MHAKLFGMFAQNCLLNINRSLGGMKIAEEPVSVKACMLSGR